jgi:hypothetical protein
MMIRALDTALAGFAARSNDFAHWAERIRRQPVGDNLGNDMVGVMVNQRAAEANLAVARTADEVVGQLMHVIA